jgi:hypothetical protein
MNERRRFFSTIGLGFLLAGGAAAAPREDLVSTAQSQRTLAPITPQRRAQYKVLAIPAGDSVEDVFNALAQENFQYAGWMRRYGDTDLFSSNGYLSSRSRRRTRHHDHLPLALITRP